MAFVSTTDKRGVIGDLKYAMGRFTNGASDTGGDITTGLTLVYFISLQHTGSSAEASEPVANETFPFSGGDVTIVTGAGADGVWFAVGI